MISNAVTLGSAVGFIAGFKGGPIDTVLRMATDILIVVPTFPLIMVLAAYARAFGGHGETVERTEDFPAAFERAASSGLPAILHLKVDPEAITPAATLTAIRERARR